MDACPDCDRPLDVERPACPECGYRFMGVVWRFRGVSLVLGAVLVFVGRMLGRWSLTLDRLLFIGGLGLVVWIWFVREETRVEV